MKRKTDSFFQSYSKAYNFLKNKVRYEIGMFSDVAFYVMKDRVNVPVDEFLNFVDTTNPVKILPTRNTMLKIVKEDGSFEYFLYTTDESWTLVDTYHKEEISQEKLRLIIYSLAFKLQNKKSTVVYKENVKDKTISGKEKPIEVIYLSEKKYIKEFESVALNGRSVDWKHSWEVMGHWRSIDGIGKDRNGEYNQNGRTWINPCVKGKGELIKKVRIFK